MTVHRFDRDNIRSEIDPDTFAHRAGPIEQRYAIRAGECYWCADIILPGEPIVAGDEDEPWMHPDCLRREMDRP